MAAATSVMAALPPTWSATEGASGGPRGAGSKYTPGAILFLPANLFHHRAVADELVTTRFVTEDDELRLTELDESGVVNSTSILCPRHLRASQKYTNPSVSSAKNGTRNCATEAKVESQRKHTLTHCLLAGQSCGDSFTSLPPGGSEVPMDVHTLDEKRQLKPTVTVPTSHSTHRKNLSTCPEQYTVVGTLQSSEEQQKCAEAPHTLEADRRKQQLSSCHRPLSTKKQIFHFPPSLGRNTMYLETVSISGPTT